MLNLNFANSRTSWGFFNWYTHDTGMSTPSSLSVSLPPPCWSVSGGTGERNFMLVAICHPFQIAARYLLSLEINSLTLRYTERRGRYRFFLSRHFRYLRPQSDNFYASRFFQHTAAHLMQIHEFRLKIFCPISPTAGRRVTEHPRLLWNEGSLDPLPTFPSTSGIIGNFRESENFN